MPVPTRPSALCHHHLIGKRTQSDAKDLDDGHRRLVVDRELVLRHLSEHHHRIVQIVDADKLKVLLRCQLDPPLRDRITLEGQVRDMYVRLVHYHPIGHIIRHRENNHLTERRLVQRGEHRGVKQHRVQRVTLHLPRLSLLYSVDEP